MISLSASGGSVVFTFANSTYYLYGDGTITVPVNSLSLVIDNSNIAMFKRAATNDIFVAAPLAEFGMSKAEIEAFYKENMVGSTGGVDPEEVVDIVESATTYFDGVEYDSVNSRINFKHNNVVEGYIDAAPFIIDGMVDNVAISNGNLVITFNTDSGKSPISIPLTDIFDPSNYYTKTEVDASLSGKADSSAVTAVNDVLTAHTANTTVHVTAGDKLYWDGKSDFSGSYNDLTDKPTIPTVPTSNTAFTNDAGYITEDAISGKADTSAVTAVNNVLTAHTADTTIHVTSSDKSTWSGKQDALVSGTNIKTINNESILGSGNITISGGGNNVVELTQAQYDALVDKDPDVFYIITDAEPINLSGYVQTSAITSAVTSASTDSQVPSAKAVYDAIGQGGGAVSSAITSGDTNAVAGGAVYDKFDEVEQVTARALIDVNSKFDGLRLRRITQEVYDMLPVKDDNTLYVISSGAPSSWITIPEGTELSGLSAYKVRVKDTTEPAQTHNVTFGYNAYGETSGNTYTLDYSENDGWTKWRIIVNGQINVSYESIQSVNGYFTVDFDGNKYPCIGGDYHESLQPETLYAPFEFEIYI